MLKAGIKKVFKRALEECGNEESYIISIGIDNNLSSCFLYMNTEENLKRQLDAADAEYNEEDTEDIYRYCEDEWEVLRNHQDDFSTRRKDNGSIYYYNHEFDYGEDPKEHITFLAASITQLLDRLKPNWGLMIDEAIDDGNLEKVKELFDDKPDNYLEVIEKHKEYWISSAKQANVPEISRFLDDIWIVNE